MGVIPGHIKDEVVVIGNHRDGRLRCSRPRFVRPSEFIIAWVMGATDPSSGTVSIHEMIKGLGVLLRSGWRPLRTIVVRVQLGIGILERPSPFVGCKLGCRRGLHMCIILISPFADVDHLSLPSSAAPNGARISLSLSTNTLWHISTLVRSTHHCFACYVFTQQTLFAIDSSTSGSRLSASASPSLSHLYREAAEAIPHPTKLGKTLWDARYDTGALFGPNAIDNGSVELDPEVVAMHELHDNIDISVADALGVNPLGSGSDYTVFLQHLGVASANGGFSSTLHDPVYHYHSVFDSERWQEALGDPGFFKHVIVLTY